MGVKMLFDEQNDEREETGPRGYSGKHLSKEDYGSWAVGLLSQESRHASLTALPVQLVFCFAYSLPSITTLPVQDACPLLSGSDP